MRGHLTLLGRCKLLHRGGDRPVMVRLRGRVARASVRPMQRPPQRSRACGLRGVRVFRRRVARVPNRPHRGSASRPANGIVEGCGCLKHWLQDQDRRQVPNWPRGYASTKLALPWSRTRVLDRGQSPIVFGRSRSSARQMGYCSGGQRPSSYPQTTRQPHNRFRNKVPALAEPRFEEAQPAGAQVSKWRLSARW